MSILGIETPFDPRDFYVEEDPVDRASLTPTGPVPGATSPFEASRDTMGGILQGDGGAYSQTNYTPLAGSGLNPYTQQSTLQDPMMMAGQHGFLLPFRNTAQNAPVPIMPVASPSPAPAPAPAPTTSTAPAPGTAVYDKPYVPSTTSGGVQASPLPTGPMQTQSLASISQPAPINPTGTTGTTGTTSQALTGTTTQAMRGAYYPETPIDGTVGTAPLQTAPAGAPAPPTGSDGSGTNNLGDINAYVGRENAVDNHGYILGRDPDYALDQSNFLAAQGQLQQDQQQSLGLASQNLGMSAGYNMYEQGQAAGANLTDLAGDYGRSLRNQGRAITADALGRADTLAGLEATQGPSAAQAQLQSGLNQANANALSMARSGRGWGGGASALSQASAQQAMNSQNAVNSSAQLRAQEDAQWRQRQAQNLGTAGNLAMAGGQAGAGVYGQGGAMTLGGVEGGARLGMEGTEGYIGAGMAGNQAASGMYQQGYQGNLASQSMANDIWKTQSAIDLAKEQDALQRYGINMGVPTTDEGNPLLGAGLGIAGAVVGGYFGGPAGASAGGSFGYGIGNNL
jgi:hypothetical protein